MTSHFTTTLPLLVALALGCTPHSTIDPSPDAGSPFDGGADDGGADGGSPDLRGGRFPDRSLARFLRAAPHDRWWIEERLAPQPRVAGDFDLGPRAIVRNVGDVRVTVWAPPETERLVDACVRADDTWSGVGIGADRQVFVAHGDRDGLVRRATLEDPSLRDEPLAWLNGPRDALRVSPLSEASPKIVCDGADTVVSLMSEDFAVLAYRLRGSAAPQRTLVAPATAVTPFLPIGGSYDDFDAMVAPYVTHLALAPSGRVFVAWLADRTRVLRYNAAFGTELDLVREQLYPRQGTYDSFVAGVDRDGTRAFTSVIGVPDVEDELFGLVAGPERVAVIGRHRRELGRDNVELHAMVSELDHEGRTMAVTSIDLEDSALAQTAAYDGDSLYVGGTEGWRQNPSGRSVFTPGSPFLVRLSGPTRRHVQRVEGVPATSGHAELRTMLFAEGRWLIGGHENGPLTHTADADPSRVRSDAWWAWILD
jgi:hypothetical protein